MDTLRERQPAGVKESSETNIPCCWEAVGRFLPSLQNGMRDTSSLKMAQVASIQRVLSVGKYTMISHDIPLAVM